MFVPVRNISSTTLFFYPFIVSAHRWRNTRPHKMQHKNNIKKKTQYDSIRFDWIASVALESSSRYGLLFERFVLKATKQIVHNWLNATSTWTNCQYVRYIPLCARPICVSVCRTIRRLRTKLRMLYRIKSRWNTKHVNHKKKVFTFRILMKTWCMG